MPALLGEKGKREAEKEKSAPAWLLPAVAVTAALLILAVSALTYLMVGYAFIYPEVYSDGVKLGGQNYEISARTMLSHVENKLAASRLLVTVGGLTEEFTPENTRAVYTAGDTARDAYAVGRTGGLFFRLGQLRQAYFGRVDIPVSPGLTIDEPLVRERVAALAARIDTPVTEYDCAIGAREVVVQNAAPGVLVDQEEIVAGVLRAFETLDFSPLRYEPKPLPYAPFDFDALRERIYVEPRDAYMDASDPGNTVLIPHVTGRDIDVAALEAALQGGAASASAPFIVMAPAIDLPTLRENLFRDELSTFTTKLSASNRPRTSNIRLAANYINGVTLAPGAVFSYNENVGRRTEERGFQEAGAYVNGQLVPEVGGGICQLSTTVYNAALLADLNIVERSCHSMTVSYVPTGRDAMVNWGTQDLRFENNTNFPIRILAEQVDNLVTVTIVGTKENDHSVMIQRVELSRTPAGVTERENPELPAGKSVVAQDPHDGVAVETYRIILDGEGNELSRTKEAVSRYRKVDKVIEHGPGPVTEPSPDPGTEDPPAPDPAPVTDPEPTPDPSPDPVPDPDPDPVPPPTPDPSPIPDNPPSPDPATPSEPPPPIDYMPPA